MVMQRAKRRGRRSKGDAPRHTLFWGGLAKVDGCFFNQRVFCGKTKYVFFEKKNKKVRHRVFFLTKMSNIPNFWCQNPTFHVRKSLFYFQILKNCRKTLISAFATTISSTRGKKWQCRKMASPQKPIFEFFWKLGVLQQKLTFFFAFQKSFFFWFFSIKKTRRFHRIAGPSGAPPLD